MSCEVTYKIHGFNACTRGDYLSGSYLKLQNNKSYTYNNHDFLDSFFINDDFERITFVLQPGKDVNLYMDQIDDELEKICFNIIAYTEIHTSQPICQLLMVKNEDGSVVDIKDSVQIRDTIIMTNEIEASVFYEKIMSINTPLADNKAIYKELFYILHNPHKVIQYIGLYDIMVNLICKPNERNKQKIVRDFFGKNKSRYSFIQFLTCNNNSKKKEDSITHLRNEIAHGKEADINQFMGACKNVTDREVSNILRVINDILAGEVDINF